MSQNQEIIESKLCAFVDGELDEAGRAEIEKHLIANPQHRRLLEELRRTSALVRGLPRENAPAELAESFNGQLERSVLLQDIGGESTGGRMRIGPGPRLYAAAAIILLMIGLAAVIYFALPSYNVHPTMANSSVRQSPPSPRSIAVPSATEPANQPVIVARGTPDDLNNVVELNSTSEKQADALGAQKRSNGEQAVASARLDESRRLGELARKAASDADAWAATDENSFRRQTRATAVASIAPGALVMLVESEDLGRTHRRLADYFAANGISWAPSDGIESDGKLETKTANGIDRGSVLRQSRDEVKTGRIDVAPAAADAAKSELPPGAIAGASTEPTTQPQGIAGELHEALAAAAQTQPSIVSDNEGTGAGLSHQSAPESAKPGAGPTGQGVAFAARMSRRQALTLGDVLEREGAAQQARVVQDEALRLADVDKSAGQFRVNSALAKETAAFGAASPSTGPSVARSEAAGKEPKNDPSAEELKKATDEPSTQLADAIPATRPDEAEVNRNLTERGGSKGRGALTESRAEAASAKDTTQPATTSPSGGLVVASKPPGASSPVVSPAAPPVQSTTQPDAVAGGPSELALSPAGLDELVNVVILIRPNNVLQGAASAQPAAAQTQPAAPTTEPAEPVVVPSATQPVGQ